MKVQQAGGVIETTVCRLVRMPREELEAWCEREYHDAMRDNVEVIISHPGDFDNSMTWTYACKNPETLRRIPIAFSASMVGRGEVIVVVADFVLDAIGKQLDETVEGGGPSRRIRETLDTELVVTIDRWRRDR